MLADVNSITVSLNETLENILLNMNKSGERIVLVIDENDKFFGTVTDSDVRRWITDKGMRGCNASQIANKDAKISYLKQPKSAIRELFRTYRVDSIPLLDENNFVIGLLNKNSPYLDFQSMAFCIMAGGKGTRLHPITHKLPKALVEVNNRPLIEHLIIKAKNEGFTDFFISVNHLLDQIKNFLGDGKKLGVNITYLSENKFLGTAGSLAQLTQEKKYDSYLVSNCDVFFKNKYSDIVEFHQLMGGSATLCAARHVLQNEFGELRIDGVNLVGFEEKPSYVSYVNAGFYIINYEVIELLHLDERKDMPSLIMAAVQKNFGVKCFHLNGFWLDVGRKSDLQKLKNLLE